MASADEWLDVTQKCVVNPDYADNTDDGWTTASGCVAGANRVNENCREFWYAKFDYYQTITDLPNGKYRVSVSGYHRNAGSTADEYYKYQQYGNDSVPAMLYANDSAVHMANIFSEPDCDAYKDLWGEVAVTDAYEQVLTYLPNQMWTAAQYFADGRYRNSVTLDVENGVIQMGVRNDDYRNNNWCIFSGWKLEYYCTPEHLTGLSFGESEVVLGTNASYVLNPVCTPTPGIATDYSLSYTSSDVTVAAVSNAGQVLTVDVGECVITCTDAVSGLSATVKIIVENSEMSAKNTIINEIQVRNVDQFIDPSWNYGAWVELYNPTSLPVDLGNAFVSDHKGHSSRLPYNFGSIPAKGFKNVWFDHRGRYGNEPKQVGFKLDIEGGTIIISDKNGVEIARQDYPVMLPRMSYARTSDGGSVWAMTGDATCECSNSGSTGWASEQLDIPAVTPDGCFYSGSLTVTATVPAGCTLIYTSNGSVPTMKNGVKYENAGTSDDTKTFNISSTKVYRFRLFQDGKLPSDVVTRSYFYKTSTNYTMPVVSVVGNYNDIFGDEYGIYVQGSGNGRVGNGQSVPCNWNMDWQRTVNFEYMVPDADGNYTTTAFSQQVDMEMCGGWSRSWEPHSFKLKVNKRYGDGDKNMDYRFFDCKPYNRNKALQLRNGGNDTNCRFKDAAVQEIVRRSGLYIDCQAWQPAHIFINGTYKKMLNIRETNNKQFAFANYGIDTDYIDQFEMSPDSGYVQKSGSKDAFNLWYEKAKSCADDAVYRYICDSLVDIDEYVNYMAVEFFLGSTDWPQNNVKGFRALYDDENGHGVGKFHFVLFDVDFVFNTSTSMNNFFGKQNYTFDTLRGIDEYGNDVTGSHITEEIEFVTIFKNMLNNATFRKKFIDTYALVVGSVFEPTRCSAVITDMQGVMNQALEPEGGNCNSSANALVSGFTASRQTTMLNHVMNYLGVSGGRSVSLASNVDGGVLLVNGMEVPTGKFSGKLYGDIQVQALAPSGYRLAGWSNSMADYKSVFGTGATWNYYCGGSLDGTSWKSDMSSYASGAAPLGYGKTGINTTLTSRLPTYYVGRTFTLTEEMLQNDLLLDYTIDDGFIVYVNGVVAGRYNMPTGTVTYSTVSTTYANGNPDTGSMTLNKSLFHEGENTICVEIHNNSTTSSDIYWDASLSYMPAVETGNYVSTDSILTLGSSAMSLTACFEPLSTDAQRIAEHALPIRVNEVGAANDVFVNEYWRKNDWIELYNNTDFDLELGGLYVSNNINKPMAFQIPTGTFADITLIPAHGRLVVWADKLESLSQLHTGFQLSNVDGLKVVVTSSAEFEANNAAYFAAHPEMKNFQDALIYDVHDYNQSVGRYPDGGNAIFRMSRPSIGQVNVHITQDELLRYDEGVWEGDPSDIGQIAIEGEASDESSRSAVFYDLLGRRVAKPVDGQLLLRGRYPQK